MNVGPIIEIYPLYTRKEIIYAILLDEKKSLSLGKVENILYYIGSELYSSTNIPSLDNDDIYFHVIIGNTKGWIHENWTKKPE